MMHLGPETILSLFTAAAFGMGSGWWLRGMRGVATDGAQLASARKEVARLEERLREVGREAMALQPRLAELENRKSELETTLEISRRDAAALRDDLAAQTAENERLRDAQSQVDDLRNEIFSLEARLAALREQIARLRGEAQQAADDVAAERAAHRATLDKLEALESLHADCDFAVYALRDQILLLRARVAELERDAGLRAEEDDTARRYASGT